MEFRYKKKNNNFTIFKNENVFKTPNLFPLIAENKKHAEIIVNQLNTKLNEKNPNSVLSLSLFACNLDENDKAIIIKDIIFKLKNDLTLFRNFDDEKLLNEIIKKYNNYIDRFSKKFEVKLSFIESFNLIDNNFNQNSFFTYLSKLNNFYLTVFYKFVGITNSTILTYFFILGEFDYKKLFALMNIENKIQQSRWGYVDEQKEIDRSYLKSLKDISFFFENIN